MSSKKSGSILDSLLQPNLLRSMGNFTEKPKDLLCRVSQNWIAIEMVIHGQICGDFKSQGGVSLSHGDLQVVEASFFFLGKWRHIAY